MLSVYQYLSHEKISSCLLDPNKRLNCSRTPNISRPEDELKCNWFFWHDFIKGKPLTMLFITDFVNDWIYFAGSNLIQWGHALFSLLHKGRATLKVLFFSLESAVKSQRNNRCSPQHRRKQINMELKPISTLIINNPPTLQEWIVLVWGGYRKPFILTCPRLSSHATPGLSSAFKSCWNSLQAIPPAHLHGCWKERWNVQER